MKGSWRYLVYVLFLAGVLLTGMIGTTTSMTFVWPVYGTLGLVAVLSLGLLFHELSFSLPRWTTLTVMALVAYLLVRASDSPVAYFAREDAAIIVLAFLGYGLFLTLLSSSEGRRRFVDALAALVILNLGFALAQALFKPTLWIVPGYERTITEKAGGLFNHPDHYAAFLAILVPLWLATAIFSRRSLTARIAAGVLATVSAGVVTFSGSTAAQIGMVVGMSAFGLLSFMIVRRRISVGKRRTLYLACAGTTLILVLLSALAAVPLARHLDRSLLTKGESLSLPLVWRAGLDQAAEAPILGTGSRTSYIYSRLFRSELLDSSAAEPEFIHNEYLQMVAEYGLVGLALLLTLLGMHAILGVRFIRSYAGFAPAPGAFAPKSDHLAFVMGAMSALGSLAVIANFDFVLHLPVFVLVASVFLAVLAAPDPMAAALKQTQSSRLIPGGGLLLVNRALLFGCGLAMTLFGVIFSRSEIHYELARLSFESDRAGFHHLRHLRSARSLDPKNPFIFTLSAHAQVAGILPELPEPARRQALEQADAYFDHARQLYPQDIFAAVGHAAVLEELGLPGEALERIRDARKQAPHYGTLMLAEAEHHLRKGRIPEAERTFAEALNAHAFRNTAAAQEGLRTLTEWKLIAEQNGIDWKVAPDPEESAPLLAGPGGYRALPDAKVVERDLAGKTLPAEEKKEDAEKTGKTGTGEKVD